MSADVALDGAGPAGAVVGSFTADGLTFAVMEGFNVELVGVSPDWRQVAGSQEEGPSEAAMPASQPVADGSSAALALPEAVACEGIDYAVASVGAYAFYLSGATAVELPASVGSVDERSFRSSDVASVTVAERNPAYASFDGALYSADMTSLLLIPEGRTGAVRVPSHAASVEASAFSHCAGVDAIAVDAGCSHLSSEDGLLYNADGTVLLRVPAGATEATVREGCTTIAAGAMEGCAKLERINAPASVTSVSPDVFAAVPTVSLPAVSVAADDPAGASQANEAEASGSTTTQLTAMVALSSADDDLPEVDPTGIEVVLPEGGDRIIWNAAGFQVSEDVMAKSESFAAYSEGMVSTLYFPRGYKLDWHSSLGSSVQVNGPASEMWSYTVVSGIDYCTVRYHASYGYYLVRDSVYPTVCVLQGALCSGISNTPDGPMLAVGARAAGSAVYFHSGASDYDMPFDLRGGSFEEPGWSELTSLVSLGIGVSKPIGIPTPVRPGYRFAGWQCEADDLVYKDGDSWVVNPSMVPYARSPLATALWEPITIDFETSAEPGDEDYPGEEKPSISVPDAVDDKGKIEVEDPKRPGYVFQGWTIPNAEGTEAIDQDLVYQDEADGKWYVDASKLPDYANDEGRVELTARWTSVISVDVPSAVTFYADVVTQGNESREGAASSAFGQNKVASQSEVDLRIVGLESTAVATQGSTLGADSILKKASSATPSSLTQKLFSLYPTDRALTPDDLQDPDAVSQAKPADAVDFALDDLLLEKSFAADKFTIPAGDTLNLGYRLNLAETGTELDYDMLATLDEGTSASIANISYCFAADALPSDWGEPLWIENPDQSLNPAKYLLLDDIKAAAEDLSANGESSAYYSMYKDILDRQVTNGGNPGVGPYFQLKVEGAQTDYLDLQLIGICQDVKSDGAGKAGLTFQMRDIYAYNGKASAPAGGAGFTSAMNSTRTNKGGWDATSLKTRLNATSGPGAFLGLLDPALQKAIQSVQKGQQMPGGSSSSYLSRTSDEVIWLPSMYEVFGVGSDAYNRSESLDVAGYNRFQYQAYTASKSAMKRHYASSGSAVQGWWLRSARLSYTEGFCVVIPDGGYDSDYASDNYGLAPAFCL